MLDHHHLLDELERRVDAARHAVGEGRQECARLRARLNELEATRLELLEENRELDEQNSELEAHNRHLLEKLAAGETRGGFPPPTRRAQGLAALIGHRPRKGVPTPAPQQKPQQKAEEPASGEAGVAVDTPAETTPRESFHASSHEPSEAPSHEPSQGPSQEILHDASNAELPSPQALLAQWYQRYPATFFKGHTRPLKVGIHQDLAAHEPWPEKLVRRALAGYVNLPRYLKAVREGGERIDLEGQTSGTVDAQAADHARQKLEHLQAGRAADKRAAPEAHAEKSGDTQPPGDAMAGQPQSGGKNPAAERTPTSPATLEDKLSALLAKHNHQS